MAATATHAATFNCDPAKGSSQGDGSVRRPWRTIEEVLSARLIELRDADGKSANPNAPVKGGDTILLRSGWHGVIRIPRGYNDEFITIAADKDQTPQVGWIEIAEGRKWRIKGLTVSPSLIPTGPTRPTGPTSPTTPFRPPHSLVMLGERGGEESAELVVEDCFVYSVLDTSAWTGKDWVDKPQSGIWLGRHGKGHVARNNYVLNTRFGIALCAPDCLCEGNVVANFSADGIRATRDGQIVQSNVIKNHFVGARDGDPNHDDGIQVFLFNVGTGTVRNIVLRGNIIIARESDGLPFPNPLQGIGCFDGPLVNFTVEKNVVCVNHYHGISLYDAQGCTIQDNTCFSRWPGRMKPWMMLGQKKKQASGNTVRNNLAHSFNFRADTEVKAGNNREVTEAQFKSNLSDLSAFIAAKFGPIHLAANRPRLEQGALGQGAAIEPAASAAASGPMNGPLRVHPTNPRYFTNGGKNPDGSLRAVYLTGSHTWDNLQDIGESDPPAAFDFNAYLDFLAKHNHNFIRLWRWELVSWDTKANREKSPRHLVCAPHPWARTGPGTALDGKPKFNLEQFDETYFQRLRSRVEAARDRGIYVSIMLFEGWGLRFAPGGYLAHPFHPSNNVNSLDGELKGSVKGTELFTLASPKITVLQEAYVRKVIDTVNDLDNVLYEIANESDFSTTDWQYRLIRFIKAYEAKKPRQHPVGMTSIGYGKNPTDLDHLLKSPADWISPSPDKYDYKNDPPAADGNKIILPDTDHLWGVGGSVQWVWKSFLRGLNPIFMDPYRRGVLDRGPDAQWEPIRRAMGVTHRLAARMNLAAMTPHNSLASTSYCLADPGKEYLIYLPHGGEVTVDLSAAMGELAVEWMDPVEGTVTRAEPTTGGGQRIMEAPLTGDAVLYLRRK
jgi:parallel beta-helix repeat protein